MKRAYQRNAERATIAKIVDSARPRLPASAEKQYLAHLGISLPSAAMQRSRRAEFNTLMTKVRDSFHVPKLPKIFPRLGKPQLDSNVPPPTFPFCFSAATDCQVDRKNSCDADQASLKLIQTSNGLGGLLGIEAIPTIPPMTGSLFYTVQVPTDGMLTAIAEVSFTGIISCRSDLAWPWGDELPTVYGEAQLTLRVIIHESFTTRQEMLIQAVHSKPFPGEVSTFNDDIYVLIASSGVSGPNVSVEVQVDLWAFGRSDYGFAELDFASGNFGIRVPAMCFGFTPFGPIF